MKIAVLFPGIGYHCDKPLLYYSGKLAQQYQYELRRVSYSNLNQSIPEAFADAYAQTEACLADISWSQYEDVLFLSKSIGTAVAAAYAQKHQIPCRNVYYTPLSQTFDFAPLSGIFFHGTCDPWAETAVIQEICGARRLPLTVIGHANHSLELLPENVPAARHKKSITQQNIHILENIMTLTEQYIADGIFYRTLCADEICPALFHGFIRHQNVVKCWRKENGNWVIRDAPFIDDWTPNDYQVLIRCLQNTVQTGGLVLAAFKGHDADAVLKGFVSVEPTLFGGDQRYLDLSSIHVSEDMRQKGIGKALFVAARDWAASKGARKLYISAHSAVETQDFYKTMGCVEAQVYDQHHVEQEPYDCQLECTLAGY